MIHCFCNLISLDFFLFFFFSFFQLLYYKWVKKQDMSS